MAIVEEDIRYEADGNPMKCVLYRDDAQNGPRPGILFFPSASGFGDWCRHGARRMAEHGYVVLASDYWGNALFDGSPTAPEIKWRYEELIADSARKRIRAVAAMETLQARPEVDKSKIAAMGYCFGGAIAMELALSGADIAAAIGFHTSFEGIGWSDAANIKGRILVCNGADDPVAPIEQRIAFEHLMKRFKVRWQITVYGGVVHSFTDPWARAETEWTRYNRYADLESLNAALFLLRDVFGT